MKNIFFITILLMMLGSGSLFAEDEPVGCVGSFFNNLEVDYAIGYSSIFNNTSPHCTPAINGLLAFRFLHYDDFSFGFSFSTLLHSKSSIIVQNLKSYSTNIYNMSFEYDFSDKLIVEITLPFLILSRDNSSEENFYDGVSFYPGVNLKYVFGDLYVPLKLLKTNGFHNRTFWNLSYQYVNVGSLKNHIVGLGVGFTIN